MFNEKGRQIAIIIEIRGLVQGVGFRPFIYQIAIKHQLKGWVKNTNENVLIKVQGSISQINDFIDDIIPLSPLAARIDEINKTKSKTENLNDFSIVESESVSSAITDVSPDIAVCEECLEDLQSQDHRIAYPFVNCTNCGPRFSIIKAIPYDRSNTTMRPFCMCKICKKEYEDINDRRFHAQPIACNHCGPEYAIYPSDENHQDIKTIIARAALLIQKNEIIAIKGSGGFHLACNALNNAAVKKLRASKIRESKPFAVMFRDVESLKEYAFMDETELESIASWRRPILLLKMKKNLAEEVTLGLNTIGAMLPYLPFHYMLFKKLDTPVIVLTSGNLTDDPIIIENTNAINTLAPTTAAVVINNRDIHNRTDDSVAMIVNKQLRLIRRSRGFAPSPISIDAEIEGILATGAELNNCFCIGKGRKAIMSQHIGDLKNMATYDFFYESYQRYCKLFQFKPKLVVRDLHPDYLSSRFAEELDLPVINVQHHHAHILSCMAECNLDEEIIGVSLDGTGYGTDGHIWGGEFLFCQREEFERYTHFDYLSIPGGDIATKETWRSGLALLYKYYGSKLLQIPLPFLKSISREKLTIVLEALDKQINTPQSSSAGRLFDAIAAMTGLCTTTNFHAEAPMRLESFVSSAVNINECYSFDITEVITWHELAEEIIYDVLQSKPMFYISTKFHNTIIKAVIEVVEKMRIKKNIDKVCLSGGSFQNQYLLYNIENVLQQRGFSVYSNSQVPVNDGGIALGQILYASQHISSIIDKN